MSLSSRAVRIAGVALVALLIGGAPALAAPFTASTSGAWNDPVTWGGSGVPGASDDVTIAAGVTVDVTPGAAAASLTIQAGATLRRYSGQDGVLELPISGAVVNRGTILWCHPVDFGYDRLALRIGGDVTNEGTWDADYTVLDGAGVQALRQSGDGLANGLGRRWIDETPASPLTAGTDLHFTGPVELRGTRLALGAHRLRLSGTGATLDGGASGATITVADGGVIEDGPDRSVWNVRVEGPVRLEGTLDVGANVVMSGPVTVAPEATVRRYSGQDGVVEMRVEGALTNLGTILWCHPVDFGYDRLALRVGGDVTNEGTWDADYTVLDGVGAQTLRQSGDGLANGFGRLWVDDTPGSSLVAGSDLRFTGPVELRGSALQLGGHRLELDVTPIRLTGLGGSATEGGRIETSAGAVLAFPGAQDNGTTSLQNVRVVGPVRVEGVLNVGLGVTVGGPVEVASGAIIQRASGNDGLWELTVEGALTNHGEIRYCHPLDYGYDRLGMVVGGDVTNDGIWDAATTRLTGTAAQTLTSSTPLGRDWSDSDASSAILGGSDLTFSGTLRLQGGRLAMGAHRLAFTATGGTLLAGGTVAFDVGVLAFEAGDPNGSYSLQDVRVEGTYGLAGVVNLGTGVVWAGTAEITPGTIVQRASGNDGLWFVRVEGTLTNRGEVRYCHPWDYGYDRTGVELAGSLVNLGTWDVAETRLVGDRHPNITTVRPFTRPFTFEATAATPFGHVVVPAGIASGTQSYDAVSATFEAFGGAGLDSLTVDAFGDRTPGAYGNAARSTWTLRPSPASARATLNRLTFRYRDALLGPNDEAALQVYHSTDGGQTWVQVSTSTNLQRDAAINTVTLLGAPAYGVYALSSQADPVAVLPNLVTSIVGPDKIRVGPPNRYVVTYANTGPTPTGDFVMSFQTDGGIYIEAIEPSASGEGGTPRPMTPDEFSTTGDSTYAVLWVSNLDPGQERSFTAILRTRRDIGQTRLAQVRVIPLVAAGVALGVGVAGGVATSYVKDIAKNILLEQLSDPLAGADAVNRAFDKVNQDWFGGAEKPMGEVHKEMVGQFRDRLHLQDPVSTAADIADTFGDIADAMRAGQDRMARLPDAPGGGRFPLRFPDAPRRTPEPVRSWDPNDKSGPGGVGDDGYVTALGRMTYLIRFENKAEASAPAYEIVVVDTLAVELDPETVGFGPTSWPGFTMTREGRVLTWRATGIELPPNVTPPEGEGFVQFSVDTVPGLPDGTRVANRAEITFDINDPIMTNTHVNTLDLTAPTTTMTALAAETPANRLVVRWSAADRAGEAAGAGVYSTTLFASRDGGPFEAVGTTSADSLAVDAVPGSTYAFYALATDAVGNAEAVRPAPVQTAVVRGVATEGGGAFVFALDPVAPNPIAADATVRFSLDRPGDATLELFDVLGRRVMTLAGGPQEPGPRSLRIDARGLASGVYVLRLSQHERTLARSLTVVR